MIARRSPFLSALLWCVAILWFSGTSAYAVCPPNVTPAESPAPGQTIGSDSECTVEAGASIQSGAVDGITAVDRNTITNNGSISAVGSAEGISAEDDNTIINNGFISSAGNNGEGIDAEDGNTIINNGSISSESNGIDYDENNTIINNGTITTTGDVAEGFDGGDNNTSINRGTISTSGRFAHGIIEFDDNTIVNSGLITTTGSDAHGMQISDRNSVSNSGTIVVTGANAFAFQIRANDNTLNLLQDSRIVGLIDNQGSGNTLNLGRGESWLISFESTGNPPATLNTFGMPTAILSGGFTVATFDPATTIFGHEDDAFADMMGEVRNGLDHRLTSGNPTTYLWAHGFGGGRNGGDFEGGANLIRDPSLFRKTEVDEREFQGVMAGFSTQAMGWLRGGLFIGAGESEILSERARSIGDTSRRHTIEADDVFGGLYARAFFDGGLFADLIVSGGTTDRTSRRRILNNTVATGVEFAVADYDGWHWSPELTVGVEVPVATNASLVPSASIGYTNLSLDGFQETGSIAAVSIDNRNLETVDGRLQLELRSQIEEAFRASLRGGVKARSTSGDDQLSGVLAGTTAFTVDTDGTDEDEVAGFVGADLTWTPLANFQFYAGGEIAFGDDARAISGRVGGAYKF